MTLTTCNVYHREEKTTVLQYNGKKDDDENEESVSQERESKVLKIQMTKDFHSNTTTVTELNLKRKIRGERKSHANVL